MRSIRFVHMYYDSSKVFDIWLCLNVPKTNEYF